MVGIGGGGGGNCDGREFCVCAACDGAADTFEGVVRIKSSLRRRTFAFSGEKIIQDLPTPIETILQMMFGLFNVSPYAHTWGLASAVL